MSAITSTQGRRAAARNAAERRKKLILVALAIVLVALLAFQLPKLLKHSGSSSSAASTPASTPATATAAPTTAATASPSLAAVSTPASAKRMRAIRRMSAADPFVPLIQDSTASPSSASTSSSAPAAQPATQSTLAVAPAPATPAAAALATPMPAVTNPFPVKPAAPTAAVIWTNGQRQIVGLSQVFSVGDAQLRLVSVTRQAIRIKLVGGAFAGGKQAIPVRKGHPLKLVNSATGVQYRLLFTAASSNAVAPTNPNDNR